MRLVDLLVRILEAHAQTLNRLAALFDEDILVYMLEESGDELIEKVVPYSVDSSRFEVGRRHGFSSPHAELSGAVTDFHLSARLEFYLWAYPFYRNLVESEVDLDALIPLHHESLGQELVDEASQQAARWIKLLPIADEFRPRAEQVSHVAWLRFRTEALKKIGKRSLGPVY